jgi:hypothetical protein
MAVCPLPLDDVAVVVGSTGTRGRLDWVVADPVGFVGSVSAESGLVYDGMRPRPTVGSNGTQPTPAKYSSGHACRSSDVTLYTALLPNAPGLEAPGRYPIETREGIPRVRAMIAIADAK